MSDPAPYPYASGDRLEQRNTYFYTPYHGTAFLEAWRRQRADALRDLSAQSAQGPGGGAATPEPRPTDRLLEALFDELHEGGPLRDASLRTLNRLVQRFEVTKRIHGEYDADWRPLDATDYHSMDRYVRLAEVLDLAHAGTGALPYLNALLKVVDTLTSRPGTLDAQQRSRLAQVIARERNHVERLAARLPEATHAA